MRKSSHSCGILDDSQGVSHFPSQATMYEALIQFIAWRLEK